MNRVELGLWIGGCAVVGGGVLAYDQIHRRQRSELEKKLEAARAAAHHGDHARAAKVLRECSEAMGSRATDRAKTVVAIEAADAYEETGATVEAERSIERALIGGQPPDDADVEAKRRRAVLLDRLGSLHQTRGDIQKASELYREAVLVLTRGTNLLEGDNTRLRPVAFDLAGIMHNYATCDFQRTGDAQRAITVLDQARSFCDLVHDNQKRDVCIQNVDGLRTHIRGDVSPPR